MEEKVILYVYKDCIPCKRAEERLRKYGIEYILKHVESSLAAREELEILTGRTLVPVILNPSNGKLIIGCPVSEEAFLQELERVLERRLEDY